MVRMQATSRPLFVVKDLTPALPKLGGCVLVVLAGMLIYQLAGPGRADGGSGGTSNWTDAISIAPPSLVFEGDHQGQIHFGSDPRQ